MALTVGTIIFIATTGSVLLMSVLSNAMVIYVVYRNKRMRNVTNLLICNLAASDILFGAFVLPQNLHDITHTESYDEGTRNVLYFVWLLLFLFIVSFITP